MNTALGKRTLRDRSKYEPHQSARERFRRLGQFIRMGGTLPPDLLTSYIDYSTAKAAKQDLTRFKPKPAEEYAQIEEYTPSDIGSIGDDMDGLMDVTVIPETGTN